MTLRVSFTQVRWTDGSEEDAVYVLSQNRLVSWGVTSEFIRTRVFDM